VWLVKSSQTVIMDCLFCFNNTNIVLVGQVMNGIDLQHFLHFLVLDNSIISVMRFCFAVILVSTKQATSSEF